MADLVVLAGAPAAADAAPVAANAAADAPAGAPADAPAGPHVDITGQAARAQGKRKYAKKELTPELAAAKKTAATNRDNMRTCKKVLATSATTRVFDFTQEKFDSFSNKHILTHHKPENSSKFAFGICDTDVQNGVIHVILPISDSMLCWQKCKVTGQIQHNNKCYTVVSPANIHTGFLGLGKGNRVFVADQHLRINKAAAAPVPARNADAAEE